MGLNVTGIALTPLANVAVGTFTVANGLPDPGTFSATIDWGDGTASAGLVSLSNGTYTVTGSHTYADENGYSIQVVVAGDGLSITIDSTAQITGASTSGGGGIVAAAMPMEGYEYSPPTIVAVATFTEGDGSLPAGDFGATIDWGDGTTSAGVVTLAAGIYTVAGRHEYFDEGRYMVRVRVAQTAGPLISGAASATVSATATIHEELLAEGTVGTPDQRWIQEAYRDLFGRKAEPQGREFWVAELAQGVPRQQVAYQIVKTASFQEFQHDTVTGLYEQYLGRAPDAAGLTYWSGYLYDGGTIEGMSQALVSSAEYWQVRSGGTVNGFLTALFHDAFGRPIEPAALKYFSDKMVGGASAADVTEAVFSSDEYHRLRVNALFEHFMDRSADAGALAYFADELDAGQRDELVISQLISSDEYFEHVQI